MPLGSCVPVYYNTTFLGHVDHMKAEIHLASSSMTFLSTGGLEHTSSGCMFSLTPKVFWKPPNFTKRPLTDTHPPGCSLKQGNMSRHLPRSSRQSDLWKYAIQGRKKLPEQQLTAAVLMPYLPRLASAIKHSPHYPCAQASQQGFVA